MARHTRGIINDPLSQNHGLLFLLEICLVVRDFEE